MVNFIYGKAALQNGGDPAAGSAGFFASGGVLDITSAGVRRTTGGLSANCLYASACATTTIATSDHTHIHRGISGFLSNQVEIQPNTPTTPSTIPRAFPNTIQM
jgi:hypothetical protein